MAAQVQEVVRLYILVGNACNLVGKLECLFHQFGEVLHGLDDICARFKGKSALATEQEGDHCKDGHLAGERLGGGHADFGTCVQVDTAVACAGDCRAHAVTDGKCGCTLLLGFLKGGECIGRFTGLANGKDECTRLDNRVPVTEFRGVFDFDRNAGQVFDHVFADHTGIVARAAGGNDDAVDVPQFPNVGVEARQLGVAFGVQQASAHGVAEHFGLFENFLQHEVGEAALGNCVCVKFDILHFVLHGLAVRVQQVVSVVLDFDDVVVVQVDNLLRVHDNCRNVGGEVEFVLSDAQNKRRSAAGADEGAGFALANNGKAERTFDERNGFQYSFF